MNINPNEIIIWTITVAGLLLLLKIFGKNVKDIITVIPDEWLTPKGRCSLALILILLLFSFSSPAFSFVISYITPSSIKTTFQTSTINTNVFTYFVGLACIGNLFLIAADK